MSSFTLAYLARLELWSAVAFAAQGGLLWLSWRAWARTVVRPGLRHGLACAHFAALAILPLATLVALHLAARSAGGAPMRRPPTLETLTAGSDLGLWFAAALAIVWFAGVAVMAFRLALEARRLARLELEPAPDDLVGTVERLTRDWALTPDIRAAAVAAPQVVGLWRPLLLAPGDLHRRLPPAELDAVLLHELAHVRRGDFGWNLLQRLVLALLWPHPAAWSLYGHVAREREACCDALAVRGGASAAGLARGLVRLVERQAQGNLAMAASGHGDLEGRILRLAGGAAPARRGGGGLAVAASALCLLGLGSGRIALADPGLADLCAASALGPTVLITARDPAGAFALRLRQGRVVEASVERQPVPRERILQHGRRVVLVSAARRPILDLTVTPQNRIRWEART